MPVVKLAMPMSFTSPAAPQAWTVQQGCTFFGLDDYGSVTIDALLLGATGGTLDIVWQSSVKGGRWYDVARSPTIAAGAVAARYLITFNRARGGGTTSPTVVNPVDGTPTIAANTVYQFNLGDAVRMLVQAGGGTSASANQVIDGTAYQI